MLHLHEDAVPMKTPVVPRGTGTVPPPRPGVRYRGAPLLGPLLEMRRDYLGFCHKAAQLGDVVQCNVGPVTTFMLGHPDHVQHVLVDHFRKYEKKTRGYQALRRVVGLGLVTSEGAFWQRQRRIANPAFKKQRVMDFGAVMTQAAARMTERWEPHVQSGQPLDIAAEMMRVTLEIVGRTLLSTDVGDRANEVGPALHELLAQTMERITDVVNLPDFVPTPANRRFLKARATLDRIVLDIIAQRRRTGDDPGDLLSMLMNARDEVTGEAMDDTQLRDEAMTIFLAGHETTANALTWALHLLAGHPAVEAKVRAELAILDGKLPTSADLARLPYLGQVVKETMRLYPPVWVLARSASEEDVIGGMRIPKGSFLFLCTYTLHRDPRFWERPDDFWPERWDGDPKLPHKFQYLPFSVGGRKCIGDHFATLEAVLILATVLQKVELRMAAGARVELEPVITLRPKHGMAMVASRVEGGAVGLAAADGAGLARATGAAGCPFHAGAAGDGAVVDGAVLDGAVERATVRAQSAGCPVG